MINEHEWTFVLLAFVAALLGSWVALDLQEQARSHAARFRRQLLFSAALGFGVSIFVTHFIAMLGLKGSAKLAYDPGLTGISLLLAVLGSGLAVWIVHRWQPSSWRTASAAFTMGSGICAMHYVGMEALSGALIVDYEPILVLASFSIAVAASWIAMQFGTRRYSLSARAGGAALLAVAVCGMHFTGMAAAHLHDAALLPAEAQGLKAADLSISIGVGGLALVFLAVLASISARAKERERLLNLQQGLNRAARFAELGAVAATLAHELNQPLTAAANYAFTSKQIWKADPASPQLCDAIEKAEAQVRRAGDIIKRIRAMVTEGGVLRQPVDLRESLDRSLDVLRSDRSLKEPRIAIAFGTGEHIALGDRVQVEQVLINIIRNSWQVLSHVKDGTLRIRATASSAGSITLSISDNGPGFVRDDLEDLFSTFKSSNGGLGIGLSIARTIIDAHGGKLWAENNNGRGATFHISLPTSE